MKDTAIDSSQRYETLEIIRCSAMLPVGVTVEIGTDVMTDFRGNAVTSIPLSDCSKMPFEDNSVNAIMMYDVLHQLDNPSVFFAEVERVLAPKGRLILTAPAITPLSWVIYTLLGKRLDIKSNPLAPQAPLEAKDSPLEHSVQNDDRVNTDIVSYLSKKNHNYFMPSLLFWFQEHRIAFNKAFPSLTLINRQWTGYITYLPTKLPSFIAVPDRWYGRLFDIERWLRPFVGRLIAPKCRITLEKRG